MEDQHGSLSPRRPFEVSTPHMRCPFPRKPTRHAIPARKAVAARAACSAPRASECVPGTPLRYAGSGSSAATSAGCAEGVGEPLDDVERQPVLEGPPQLRRAGRSGRPGGCSGKDRARTATASVRVAVRQATRAPALRPPTTSGRGSPGGPEEGRRPWAPRRGPAPSVRERPSGRRPARAGRPTRRPSRGRPRPPSRRRGPGTIRGHRRRGRGRGSRRARGGRWTVARPGPSGVSRSSRGSSPVAPDDLPRHRVDDAGEPVDRDGVEEVGARGSARADRGRDGVGLEPARSGGTRGGRRRHRGSSSPGPATVPSPRARGRGAVGRGSGPGRARPRS